MKNLQMKIIGLLTVLATLLTTVFAQTEMPKPSAPRSVKIPTVMEKALPNGLTVVVSERKNVPLVTIQLLVNSGAGLETLFSNKYGLANLTASLLTKGTRTRTATQIAQQIEFLGGSINSGAGWNNSVVNITVSSDKLDEAMTILSDVVLNPTFNQKEIDLMKSQIQDGLAYNLQQPGFLANYVASKYSFLEHPSGGTPNTIKAITRKDILDFKKYHYYPNGSTLIFTGDITAVRANALARKYLGLWRKKKIVIQTIEEIEPPPTITQVQKLTNKKPTDSNIMVTPTPTPTPTPTVSVDIERILVVNLPDSGQASVNFAKSIDTGRLNYDNENVSQNAAYFSASVLNSVLGGGYSSRLNQEIRIKRGLSYGAGSSFAWRSFSANFLTRTQTKNESAAEVAELVIAEIEKLINTEVSQNELAPRKFVLTGDFGRDLETTQGLAERIADYYVFNLPIANLNSYIKSINDVREAQIKAFAKENFINGDIIIVGDYSKFSEDLAKRFPDQEIEVIQADELDLSKENLRK